VEKLLESAEKLQPLIILLLLVVVAVVLVKAQTLQVVVVVLVDIQRQQPLLRRQHFTQLQSVVVETGLLQLDLQLLV
jgi:hypothetical protein